MYELNAEGNNGVNDTTRVGALSDFNIPQAAPNSTGEPQAKAIWFIDGSSLTANWPTTGPVDGLWSIGGNGGARGVVGWGAPDGNGVGVAGNGGGTGGLGTGVMGNGVNGVVGTASGGTSSDGQIGIAVVGQNAFGGTGIVGWAASPPPGIPFDGGSPIVTPLTMPAGVTVGIYGCISDQFSPSRSELQSGVWGDARNSAANTTASGVMGTSQAGSGVAGSSGTGNGVTGSSEGGTGVTGLSNSGPGGVFQSDSVAQLRLVPSPTPLVGNTLLLETGQVGDLYLFSQAAEVGTTGTYHYATILWLCIAPAAPGGQSVWAPVQLGDTIGG